MGLARLVLVLACVVVVGFCNGYLGVSEYCCICSLSDVRGPR